MPYQPITGYPVRVKKKCLFMALILMLTVMSCRRKETDNSNHPAYADSIINHADSLSNYGQTRQSINYLDSAYRAFQNPGPIDLWKKYKQKSSYYLNTEFNLNNAQLYADSMAAVLKGKNKTDEEQYVNAWTFFAQANVFVAEKKYTEAFRHYYDGRILAKKSLDSCTFCQFSYQLGLIKYKQGQYLQAIPYLKQAINENSHCKANSGFYNLLFTPQAYFNTLALCYERGGKLDSAIYYYKRGLFLIDQQVTRFPDKTQFIETARGVFYGNIGGVYTRLRDYKNAEKCLKEDIQLNDRFGHAIEDAQTAEIKLIELYFILGDYKKANVVLQEIEKDLSTGRGKSEDSQKIWIDWYRLKWIYFDKTHNLVHAYEYLQKYYHMRDSVSEVNQGLKKIDMDAAFKENEQQHKVTLLSRDNELKTAYLLAIILFSIMAVCILLVIWYNLKRSRKNVAELIRLNHQINEHNTQMQQALAALEQSQEDNTRIMKIVAHDLRSPIASTISVTSLLLESGNYSEQDRELLDLMKTSNLQSINMITNLLTMNIKEQGLKKEPVELQVLLQYCVDLLKFKASEKQQKITLTAQKITVDVDREKIWRVVSNLIMNAIKFSPEGATINVRMYQEQNTVQIIIQDYGIGIPDNIKDKVFTMFTDAKRAGTSGEQSFGLGLAISRQIVEAHEGKIWLESREGKGTTFYVELPVA